MLLANVEDVDGLGRFVEDIYWKKIERHDLEKKYKEHWKKAYTRCSVSS